MSHVVFEAESIVLDSRKIAVISDVLADNRRIHLSKQSLRSPEDLSFSGQAETEIGTRESAVHLLL